MKRKGLIIPLIVLAFILTFTLLPVSFVYASPGNLVKNYDFLLGDNGDWDLSGGASIFGGRATVGPSFPSIVHQHITNISKKDYGYAISLEVDYYGGGSLDYGFDLYDNGGLEGEGNVTLNPADLPEDTPVIFFFKLSDIYGPLPDFDEISVYATAWDGCKAWIEYFRLEAPGGGAEGEQEVWVRDREMACKQVWINEDNKFQFSFIYPYRDNNWVKIYDMSGKMVYEIDMPYDNPNIIVDLPDGMYTVKTFNVDPATPIQTFVIGKP